MERGTAGSRAGMRGPGRFDPCGTARVRSPAAGTDEPAFRVLSSEATSPHPSRARDHERPHPRRRAPAASRGMVHLRLGGWGTGWHDSHRSIDELRMSAVSLLDRAAPGRCRRLADRFALAAHPVHDCSHAKRASIDGCSQGDSASTDGFQLAPRASNNGFPIARAASTTSFSHARRASRRDTPAPAWGQPRVCLNPSAAFGRARHRCDSVAAVHQPNHHQGGGAASSPHTPCTNPPVPYPGSGVRDTRR